MQPPKQTARSAKRVRSSSAVSWTHDPSRRPRRRPGDPHDGAGLAEYEHEPDEAKATASSCAPRCSASARPSFALIAEDDAGAAVGFALYFLNFSTWNGTHGIYLEDLFVLPDARGGGHGRALLRELARIAVERGYGRVDWSVLDWNEPSIGFYKSLGAVPMDEWTTMRLTGDALQTFGGGA